MKDQFVYSISLVKWPMYHVAINLCYEISHSNYSDLTEDYVKLREDCFAFITHIAGIVFLVGNLNIFNEIIPKFWITCWYKRQDLFPGKGWDISIYFHSLDKVCFLLICCKELKITVYCDKTFISLPGTITTWMYYTLRVSINFQSWNMFSIWAICFIYFLNRK